MSVSLYIARRLSLRRDTGSGTAHGGGGAARRSPAVAIAITGIALSVAIMLLTLAIVPGFKHQITRKVMGFDAQLVMHPVQPTARYDGSASTPVRLTPTLRSMIADALPPGADISLSMRLSGILKTDSQFAGLVFKASDGGAGADSFIADNLEAGVIPDFTADSTRYHIVISRSTADALGLDIGHKVNAYFFTADNLRSRRFTVAGIYNSHFNEYDRLLAFISPQAARPLCSLADGEGTSIEIRGIDTGLIPRAHADMQRVATEAFYNGAANCYTAVNDVYELDPMYFNWLDLLDTNVVVIIALMACVAAATLISCLFIMILERVRLIGTLKALGADNITVERIFLFMAERVVLRGILIGDIAALLLVWLQWQFALVPLDPEAYYLSAVPVEFNWLGFLILNIAAALLALAIMIIPAMTVARISPAKVIRWE